MRSATVFQLIVLMALCVLLTPASFADVSSKTHAYANDKYGDWAHIGGSYSTLYGPTAHASLKFTRINGSENSTKLRYRAGPDGEEGVFKIWRPSELATGKQTASFEAKFQHWDHIPYESVELSFKSLRMLKVTDRTQIGVGVFADYDDVTNIDMPETAILSRDLGESSAIGVTAVARYADGDFQAAVPDTMRQRHEVNAQVSVLGDRQYAALEVASRIDIPLSEDMYLKTQFEAGTISGLDDSYVSVLDRAFQGHVEPRGFDWGGLGPRDLATNDPLGGSNYYWGSAELRYQLPETPVQIGAFVDFGSTWDVPDTVSANLVDDHDLRASAGISVEIRSRIGNLRMSYAEPFERQSYDDTQSFTIALTAGF